jgi:hypothetical protein
MNTSSQIWAITTYFNPSRYRRRLANFRRFRNALRTPLLVVEFAYGDEAFELCDDDADTLVQVRGASVLWQKERLCNVAVQKLPAHVNYVAWLDCDIEFSEAFWAEAAVEALQRDRLVQLFENLIDLEPESTSCAGTIEYTGKSLASFVTKGGPETKEFPPGSAKKYRPRLPGGAWAGHRSLLAKHGFYDAMILGGGDGAFVLAAYGRFDEVLKISKFNGLQALHYLRWARPFFNDAQGRVGFLSGDLFHYWHGDLANRQYGERYEALSKFDFDPFVDVRIDHQGCLAWSSEKTELHEFVKNYWNLRQEDGPA